MDAYPIRMKPIFQDYVWGGRNLGSQLGKAIPAEGNWAESWEVVDHGEQQSVVENGPLAGKTLRQVAGAHRDWLYGKSTVSPSGTFPLLLKYLDCQRDLSVQVHPNDDYGLKMTPPDLGKTEAWYIVSASPGAILYAGLRKDVKPAQIQSAIDAGKLESCLHTLEPAAGDCIFIPAGTVHALGAGLLVAEIQQASNTTFRLYDWNRLGNDGKPRPLHIQQALEVIDYQTGPRCAQVPQPATQPGRTNLVTCDKFVLDLLSSSEPVPLGGDQRFHILTSPTGGATLHYNGQATMLSRGESLLLPAAMASANVTFQPDSELLDMYLPLPA